MTSQAALADEAGYVARYRRDGFVHIPGLIGADEIETFKAAIDEAVARRTERDTRAFAERTPYEQSFRQCIHLWMDFPNVRPLDFHPKLAGAAAALLGCEAVRLWHDQALYKEPGGRGTEAHQDHAYWPVTELDMLTAWIPLVDVDHETGCMGYVPGTQSAERTFVNIFTAPGEGDDYARRFGEPVYVPAKRGDVIFHSARTVHMAKPNRSTGMRAVHTVVYFRDGCTWSADRLVGRDDIRPGMKIESDDMPIAWPLAPGAVPQPPDQIAPSLELQSYIERGVMPARTER